MRYMPTPATDDGRLAPTTGFFTHETAAYRYRLVKMTDSVAQWAVTRTEAGIVETPARANQAAVETAIRTDFGPDVPGQPGRLTAGELALADEVVNLPPPADVCNACGTYVPGGSDPVVMSAHDAACGGLRESEEQ
jgi:hypothetical protein